MAALRSLRKHSSTRTAPFQHAAAAAGLYGQVNSLASGGQINCPVCRFRTGRLRAGVFCRAQALMLEEAPAVRLDVTDFLRDSLPSEAWFGGWSYGPPGRHAWASQPQGAAEVELRSSLEEPRTVKWIDWGGEDSGPENARVRVRVDLAAQDSMKFSRPNDKKSRRGTSSNPSLPSASIVSIAAAALLVVGRAHAVAPLPFAPQGSSVQPLAGMFEVRPSLYSASQLGNQSLPGEAPVQSSATSRKVQSSSPSSLGPRLPVLVYDPDELLREPPKEEASKSAAGVQRPVDLAESLQKGCGGPACFTTLFRPSAELEVIGFAGAVILGVVSERRRHVLGQLQDLVRVAQDQKHESEALVASLQQELQQQRSLLSDVLQQRVPLSTIPIQVRQQSGPARPPEKSPIGSREWMEGIRERGLEALGGKKGTESAVLNTHEHAYFSKMGQVHGYSVGKPPSLVSEGVSRALGLVGESLDERQVAQSGAGAAAKKEEVGAAGLKSSTAAMMRYVIPDTNQFLRNLPQIKRLREKAGVQTVVPLAVLKELDGLQSHPDKRAGSLARRALRYMSQEMAAGVTWLRGQRRSEVRCLVGSDAADCRSSSGQSPQAAWQQTTYRQQGEVGEADDALVDCCVHFSEGGSEVTLLTDDKTLQLKAMFHAVKSRPITDFLARLENEAGGPVELPTSIDTEMAIDQLRRFESSATLAEPAMRQSSPRRGPREREAVNLEEIERSAKTVGSSDFGQEAELVTGGTIRQAKVRTVAGLRQTDRTRKRPEHSRRSLSLSEAEVASPVKDDLPRPEGRQTQGGRPRGRRGRATTPSQKGDGTSGREERDSDSESNTQRGRSSRNRTQRRRPQFAQTESGKEDCGPTDLLGLADMLNAQSRDGGKRTSSSKPGSRDNESRRRRPP